MARLNIEDSIWSDPRFMRLAVLLKSQDIAIGNLVRAWSLAQRYWFKKELIPEHAWTGSDFPNEIFECGLAERTENGIYVRGSKENFEWYSAKCEKLKANSSKGGIASAKARKDKFGTAQPSNRDRSIPEVASNVSNPSSSSSSSSSKKEIQNRSAKGEVLSEPSPTIQDFIGVYVKAFQTRYPEGRPDLGGKATGQIKSFLKDQNNFQRCCDLIQVFFQIEDTWFETKNYDFVTFTSNVTKIGNALDSGVSSSNGLQAWYQKQKEKMKEISA